MTRLVIDSRAWVEYLNGTEKGLKVKELITAENELFTSIISLAEIIGIALRKNMDVNIAEDAIISNSEVVGINKETVREVGVFHGQMRKKIHDFGLGDAFVVITAKQLDAKILTGDPHFKNMKEAIMI